MIIVIIVYLPTYYSQLLLLKKIEFRWTNEMKREMERTLFFPKSLRVWTKHVYIGIGCKKCKDVRILFSQISHTYDKRWHITKKKHVHVKCKTIERERDGERGSKKIQPARRRWQIHFKNQVFFITFFLLLLLVSNLVVPCVHVCRSCSFFYCCCHKAYSQ